MTNLELRTKLYRDMVRTQKQTENDHDGIASLPLDPQNLRFSYRASNLTGVVRHRKTKCTLQTCCNLVIIAARVRIESSANALTIVLEAPIVRIRGALPIAGVVRRLSMTGRSSSVENRFVLSDSEVTKYEGHDLIVSLVQVLSC